MTICPTTEEDWIQAEQRKSCATGIYHCLRTQLNFPIEVCSPRITLIQAGGCPYWNIYGNVDRDDCRKYLQCPDKPFLSNKVYQYPFCYQSLSKTTTYSTTSEVPVTTNTMLVSSTVSAERSEYEHLWLFVIMVILSCVVVVALLVFIIRYHLHVRSRQKAPEIPVNGEELTNEPNSRTPLLDGRKEEEKYEKEKWNDATSFFFTDAYKEGIATLKDEDILVIKGSPGSGKTSMAMEIMRQYDKQDWSRVWIDNGKNFDDGDISRKTIFVMDNCFGTWNINRNYCVHVRVKEVLCTILDQINQDHICKMVFIMTKEESLWYWNSLCKECPKLGRSKVIDMDCEQSFQKKDLVQYLTSKFTRDGCKRNTMKLEKSFRKLVKNDGIGFPLKVKLLCGIPNITFELFCGDALDCLKEHFNEMRTALDDTEKLKYAMLTYVLLKGRLSQEFSFDMQLSHRLNKSLNEENLKSSLANLKPYLEKDKHDFFVFEHAVLYIALFKDFYDADEITLLEHCNIDAIQQILRPQSSRDGRSCLNVMIDIESIKVLAYRIRQEGLKDDFNGHILFTNEKYKKLLD